MQTDKQSDIFGFRNWGRFIFTLILTFILSALGTSNLWAERATNQETEQVAENWLTQIVAINGSWANDLNPKITNMQEIYEDGVKIGHDFAISSGGFIIVPILKELPPVKAYSEEGQLDVNADGGMALMLRQVIKSRLDLYVETYGALDASQPSGEEPLLKFDNRQSWDKYAVDPNIFAQVDKSAVALLGPLLTSTWHQSSPYSNFCPLGDGGTCLVGCVATAAAQIANYHQWPPSGEGSHDYYWGGR